MNGTYQPSLISLLNASNPGTRGWDYGVLASGGENSVQIQAHIDADLNTIESYKSFEWILVNLSINDVQHSPDGYPDASVTAIGYILDAAHTRYPNTEAFLMRPWGVNLDAGCDAFAPLIDTVISTRPWAHLGPDERTFLKTDPFNLMADSVHPNAAGYAVTAQEWADIMLA